MGNPEFGHSVEGPAETADYFEIKKGRADLENTLGQMPLAGFNDNKAVSFAFKGAIKRLGKKAENEISKAPGTQTLLELESSPLSFDVGRNTDLVVDPFDASVGVFYQECWESLCVAAGAKIDSEGDAAVGVNFQMKF